MAGTRGRPALAHRNICLENIYLRADGVTACIGGLEYGICALPSPPPLPMEQLLLAFETHILEFGFTLIHQVPQAPSSPSIPPSADGDHQIPIATAPLFPDWWPVCGLQVGLPIYLAPEVSFINLSCVLKQICCRYDHWSIIIMIIFSRWWDQFRIWWLGLEGFRHGTPTFARTIHNCVVYWLRRDNHVFLNNAFSSSVSPRTPR